MGNVRSIKSILVLVSACAALAAGCSKPTPVPAQKLAKTVGACEALGPSDAASALGGTVTVTPGPSVIQPDGSTFISNCTFVSNEARTVNVLIRQTSDANVIRTRFNAGWAAVESLYGVKPQAVAGLGDSAFWVGGTADQLEVLAGNRWITFMVFALKSDDRLAIAKNTAVAFLRGF